MLTYDNFIFLKWFNITKELRDKILNSDANFQGQNVSFQSIIKNVSVLNLLESDDIKNILKGSSLKISSATEIKTKFFMERFFINENKKYETKNHYKYEFLNEAHDDIKTFDNIFAKLETERAFLLSSIAGEGKSTTFRNFALKLKENFPKNWIQFVELKKHSKAFKKNQNFDLEISEHTQNFLSQDLLNLTKFEAEIFSEFFKEGKIFFLWDGIDEISPDHEKFILSLTSTVKNLKTNFQLISTRPQHSKEFQKNLEIKAYKLVPLKYDEVFEFCIKYICFEHFNIDENKFNEILKQEFLTSLKSSDAEKVKKILQKLNLSDNVLAEINFSIQKSFEVINSVNSHDNKVIFHNPLLVRMVTEIATDDKLKINGSLNFYEFYNNFVLKKLKITDEKGEVIKDQMRKIQVNSQVNIMQIHQAYALKSFNFEETNSKIIAEKNKKLSIEFENGFKNLNIFKSIDKLSKEEISQFGILQIYSENDFDFAHKSFAEFFLIKYFMESLKENDENPENDLKVFLLYNLIFTDKDENYRKFFDGFLKSETKISPLVKFFENLNSKLKELKKSTLKEKDEWKLFLKLEILKFCFENYPKNNIFMLSEIFTTEFYEFLVKNWDLVLEITKNDILFFFFTVKNEDGQTILHHVLNEQFVENLPMFIENFNKTFTRTQITSIFQLRDNKFQSVQLCAFFNIDYNSFVHLQRLLLENFSESDAEGFIKLNNILEDSIIILICAILLLFPVLMCLKLYRQLQ